MPFQSEKQRRFLHANHPEIAKRWERDYGEGGIAALNAQLNQLPEYYLPAAQGGRIGFHRGSLRHQKEHDYKSLEDKGNFMRYLMLSGDRARMSSPENVINRLVNPKMGYTQKRDDFETWQKERFMYGEKKDPLINLGKSALDKKINTWLKELFAKKNGEDFIDDEELNLVKGGIANHFKKRVKLFNSVESLSDTEFQTMYPEWDPNQFTREEYLQFISENEGNGVLDLSTNEEAIEVASTEENEIIPDLLAPGSAEGILKLKDGGTPQLAQKSKSGKRPGYGGPHETEAAGKASSTSGSTGGEGGWSPGVQHSGMPTSSPSVSVGGSDQEDDVAKMMSDMGITPDHSPDYGKGWVESEDEETEIGGADYIGPKDQIRIRQDIVKKKEKYDSLWEKGKRTINTLRKIPKPTGVLWIDIPAVVFAFSQLNKLKNERIAEIDYDLSLLDKIGATKFSPHEDTIYQTLEQEKLDLLQPKTGDPSDEGPDGPPLTIDVLAETQEEVEEAPNMISMMDRIRANQAKRAMLVDKDIIQESPIVDESVTDIVMKANKGGLANLFRVKKQ